VALRSLFNRNLFEFKRLNVPARLPNTQLKQGVNESESKDAHFLICAPARVLIQSG